LTARKPNGFFKISKDNFGARIASKIEGPQFICLNAGQFQGRSANGRQGHGLRAFVFVRPFRLFTNAQALGPSTAIIRIGFNATLAAMSLAE
jgi:hypothetical protein